MYDDRCAAAYIAQEKYSVYVFSDEITKSHTEERGGRAGGRVSRGGGGEREERKGQREGGGRGEGGEGRERRARERVGDGEREEREGEGEGEVGRR